MTQLIDKLIQLGIVERLPDALDRRVINIRITSKGRAKLIRNREIMRESIRKKLSCLKDIELEELSNSMRKVRDISSRLK
jgi:DNA-binding MarR family transcriptional regulator